MNKYHVQKNSHRGMWMEIPDSHHVFIDSGCLIVYDEDDNIIIAYAAGEWIECVSDELMKAFYGDEQEW